MLPSQTCHYHKIPQDKPRFNPSGVISGLMAYDAGALDATLAAAAGDDPALLRELRGVFIESALKQLDLLERSRCDGNWYVAAMRLKGLAASFHAQELLDAAENAISTAPGDPAAVREIESVLSTLSGSNGR